MRRLLTFLVMGLSTVVLLDPAGTRREKRKDVHPKRVLSSLMAPEARSSFPPRSATIRRRDMSSPPCPPVTSPSPSAGAPFYFQAGRLVPRPARGGFVVVKPPVGTDVPILPPAYSSLWIPRAVLYLYATTSSTQPCRLVATWSSHLLPGRGERDGAGGRRGWSAPGAAGAAANGVSTRASSSCHRVLILLLERPGLLPERSTCPEPAGQSAADTSPGPSHASARSRASRTAFVSGHARSAPSHPGSTSP